MLLVCFPKGLAEAYVKGMVLSRPAAERSLCEYHDIGAYFDRATATAAGESAPRRKYSARR
jgi:hypothetical protein